jgi:hypothetical protein|eukprot:COSAG06_NODE_1252_length_10105_cov_94.930342_3_plen_137_part_00
MHFPPRQNVPGTHMTREAPPKVADEPDWMKLSTVMGLKAGGVVFRDLRAWHGGTPNLSDQIRAIPNVEYHAPWFMEQGRKKRTMPREVWDKLSDHGKHVARFCVCEPGEVPPQLLDGSLSADRNMHSPRPETKTKL